MRKELDLTWREDRLAQYVKPLLKAFVFGEFSDAFLARDSFPQGLAPVMKGVPIPLQQGDLVGQEPPVRDGREQIQFRQRSAPPHRAMIS